ncbi:MAG: hypothetical protein H7A01_02455 [Hahellaceae bacterium]|jgi:hypothetical protein|nr:hypothetical protein [Hahellaceae bacterium]MCP5212495.1 hypothetical protein [Hahellaceae bacterium]
MLKLFWLVLVLLCTFQTRADDLEVSNSLFEWAEKNFPEYFSPAGSETFAADVFYARYYEDTGIYLGTNNGNVYALGDVFGGYIHAGKISDFIDPGDNLGSVILNQEYTLTNEYDLYVNVPIAVPGKYVFTTTNHDSSSSLIYTKIYHNEELLNVKTSWLSTNHVGAYQVDISEAGTYTIKITGQAKSFYRFNLSVLSVQLLAQDDTTFEPNESQWISYPIQSGATYSSSIRPYDINDWYVVDVQAGEELLLDIYNNTESANTIFVTIYDELGPLQNKTIVSRNGSKTISYTATKDSKIYVKIEGSSVSYTSYQYTLTPTTFSSP